VIVKPDAASPTVTPHCSWTGGRKGGGQEKRNEGRGTKEEWGTRRKGERETRNSGSGSSSKLNFEY